MVGVRRSMHIPDSVPLFFSYGCLLFPGVLVFSPPTVLVMGVLPFYRAEVFVNVVVAVVLVVLASNIVLRTMALWLCMCLACGVDGVWLCFTGCWKDWLVSLCVRCLALQCVCGCAVRCFGSSVCV